MVVKQGKEIAKILYQGKRVTDIYKQGEILFPGVGGLLPTTKNSIIDTLGTDAWMKTLDYVRQKPELVPFINEDPMLVCSLVETSKTRWLVVNDARIKIDNPSILGTDTVESKSFFSYWGSTNGTFRVYRGNWDDQTIWVGYDANSGHTFKSVWLGDARKQNSYAIPYSLNTIVIHKGHGDKSSLNGVLFTNNDGRDFNEPLIYLCDATNGCIGFLAYITLVDKDLNFKWNFVPFLHQGRAGLLNLVDLQWYGRDTSSALQGDFTIELTDK
jgi:hypothetical protein